MFKIVCTPMYLFEIMKDYLTFYCFIRAASKANLRPIFKLIIFYDLIIARSLRYLVDYQVLWEPMYYIIFKLWHQGRQSIILKTSMNKFFSVWMLKSCEDPTKKNWIKLFQIPRHPNHRKCLIQGLLKVLAFKLEDKRIGPRLHHLQDFCQKGV